MDMYDAAGPAYRLSPFQHQLIRAACPGGTKILDARFVRDRLLPCPVWVRVALRRGAEHSLLLRLDRSPDGVEREARLLPLLARLGVPVAEVLAGPAHDPVQPELGAMAVYSVLPGRNLLHLINHAPTSRKPALANLLLEGIFRLQALTPALAALLASEGRDALLPRHGLRYELAAAIASQSQTALPALRRAREIVAPLVEHVQTPWCFWSGDFNPANFLSDGHRLTGFVDFAHACWHDPHYGLARFTVYPWVHLDRMQLFQQYRARHRLNERDFALRSAVHCLWLLQTDMLGEPVDEAQRACVLAQLDADMCVLTA